VGRWDRARTRAYETKAISIRAIIGHVEPARRQVGADGAPRQFDITLIIFHKQDRSFRQDSQPLAPAA
jgi:hypothetical protein